VLQAENGVTKIFLVKGAESLKIVETSKHMRRASCSECGTRIVNLGTHTQTKRHSRD